MKTIAKNDRLANGIIITLSVVVFALVTLMRRVKIDLGFEFDTHIFPAISVTLNSAVAILLLLGLWFVKQKDFEISLKSRKIRLFSILFLLTYVMYHFTTVETAYGGVGLIKTIYYIILFTHIGLAGIILPFILFAVYRGLTGEYAQHKRLTRWVWPVWFYVSVTGVVVYFMISPFY